MVPRASPPATWMQGFDFPSKIFGESSGTDYELYEEDDEFNPVLLADSFDGSFEEAE